MSALDASMPLAGSHSFTIILHDEIITDYVLDTDLVVDGRRECSTTLLNAELMPIAEHIRPVLIPGTRIYMDDEGAVRLCPQLGEPQLERRLGSVIVRRTRREAAVAGDLTLLWTLLRTMDGLHTVAELLAEVQQDHRTSYVQLLTSLAIARVVDISDRPIGRFLHTSTKKGVLPGGELDIRDVLWLVTDGDYRAYPQAARVPIQSKVPESLVPLYTILRARRSYRDYINAAIARADFEALLTTACGVTDTLEWANRELKLRAYPSSGGLYTVEIYPVVFAVEGLEPAIYHYRATEDVLEVVQPYISRKPFLDAALPTEREMLGGVAVMVCLSGIFARHEQKYGEGGYRMMVAEAGHISQNLLLASTALGLHARPFGGVFDDLLNHALGFDTDSEQVLLSVIVGYAGDKR